jgi:alanine-synthesizing transaminase
MASKASYAAKISGFCRHEAGVRYSHRLVWTMEENALARVEAERRASGKPIIDLTTSNPTQADLPYPAHAIAQAFGRLEMTIYQPSPRGLPHARAAVVADYARRGATVAPDRVVLTASSSESYALLFKLLGDAGQYVLVPEPSYPLFDYLARLEGLVPRPYRLAFDGHWHVDFASLDLSDAAAIVVVSPNNPTGSYLSVHDCDRLASLAAERGLAIIADEVFSDFPTDPAPASAFAPASDQVRVLAGREVPALCFSLGGLSKASGLPQMKVGWIAASGPSDLVASALPKLDLIADTYLSVGAPVQWALPQLLALGAKIRGHILDRVRRNRRTLEESIGPSSPCTLLPSEAGWSAIVRVPETMSDEAWALHLLREEGVLVQPGYFFDLHMGACLVVSLLAAPAAFDAGVACMLSAAHRV